MSERVLTQWLDPITRTGAGCLIQRTERGPIYVRGGMIHMLNRRFRSSTRELAPLVPTSVPAVREGQ